MSSVLENVVGREDELVVVSDFLAAADRLPAALLLEGEAGIGKTTLWDAGVLSAHERGYEVMASRPTESEVQLSFSAFADLLAGVREEIPRKLPPPQRRALHVALLREDAQGSSPDFRAVGAAFLGVLQALSRRTPLLIAIDDVPWLDSASAAVLEFATRRLRREAVGLLLTQRTQGDNRFLLALERALTDRRLRRLPVGPLSLGALHRLLLTRLGASFPRPTLRRLYDATGGNPFFALEVARALTRRAMPLAAGEPLPLPERLEDLLGERLAELPAETEDALLVASLVADATVEVVEAVVGGDGWAILRPAVKATMVRLHEQRIRFTHPLLASAVQFRADLGKRRLIHRRLASLQGSIEERASHLALAAEGPDADVATLLDEAARESAGRGAPAVAAEFAERAFALTPGDRGCDATRRRFEAAGYHLEAGDTVRARCLLEEGVAAAPPGVARAAALARLAWAFAHEFGYRKAAALFREARAEVHDDLGVRVSIERGLAWCEQHDGTLRAAEAHARAALEIAERMQDRGALASALADVAFVRFLRGHGIEERTLTRALALEREAAGYLEIHGRPSWVRGMLLEWSGELEAARSALESLYKRAVVAGDENALPFILNRLARVEYRAGNPEKASGYAEGAREASVQSAQEVECAIALATTALLDAHAGRVEAARAHAEEGLAFAERAGSKPAIFEMLSALGFLELSLGDPSAAAVPLGRLCREVPEAGFADPGLPFAYHADAAQAFLELGRLDEAEAVVEELEHLGWRLGRDSALLAAARCRGLLLAAQGEPQEALARLDEALGDHRPRAEPLELARMLLARGAIARRAKMRRVARESLEEAHALFQRLAAPLWAEKARLELGRIGGRAPSRTELTPTERRVAALVAEGRSNSDVAARLFVSVKTIEAHLTRIYAKLDVHSRGELAHRLGVDAAARTPS